METAESPPPLTEREKALMPQDLPGRALPWTEEEKEVARGLCRRVGEEVEVETGQLFILRELMRLRELKKAQAEKEIYLTKVKAEYVPLHPHLHDISGWKFVAKERQVGELRELEVPLLFTFPLLSEKTCSEIIEEIAHFEQWCEKSDLDMLRPNSMNNYGAILDDFGFSHVLDQLMKEHVAPLVPKLFKSLATYPLDHHHGFVVEYELGKDRALNFHVDDSEVTLNLCLGTTFSGGDLMFGGIRCPAHQATGILPEESLYVIHEKGTALVHLGRHRHLATELESGHRLNLILWCKSSAYRSSPAFQTYEICPRWCGLHPDVLKERHVGSGCECSDFTAHLPEEMRDVIAIKDEEEAEEEKEGKEEKGENLCK